MRTTFAFFFSALLSGCATFDAPPEVTLQGLTDGLLADVHAPIVLVFSKPPQPATVKIEIAKYIVDSDGRLGDEPGNTLGMPLQTIFTHDPVTGDTGGTAELAPDGSTMTITPSPVPPVGGELVVLVEPGIADLAGTVTKVRRRVVFGYAPPLHCDAPAQVATSGTYFFVIDAMLGQILLFVDVDVDAATGAFTSTLTRARRNPDPSRCSPPCSAVDACRTLPADAGPPTCVIPSTPAGTVDEFPDYLPYAMQPLGFSSPAPGCVIDQMPTAAMMPTTTFATDPIDVTLTTPPVTLRNAALSASFTLGSDGTLRGTGTLTADAALLDTGQLLLSGPSAPLTARSIPAGEVPPGVPKP